MYHRTYEYEAFDVVLDGLCYFFSSPESMEELETKLRLIYAALLL